MAGTCDAGFGQRQYLFYRETLKLGVFNAFVSCSEDPALAKPARVSSPVTRWTRPFYPSGNQKRRAPKGQLLGVSWAKHHRLPRRLQQPVRPRQHQRRTPHPGPPSRHAQTAHLLQSRASRPGSERNLRRHRACFRRRTWKVQEAYSYLMEMWEPDDRVFIFGFSR